MMNVYDLTHISTKTLLVASIDRVGVYIFHRVNDPNYAYTALTSLWTFKAPMFSIVMINKHENINKITKIKIGT